MGDNGVRAYRSSPLIVLRVGSAHVAGHTNGGACSDGGRHPQPRRQYLGPGPAIDHVDGILRTVLRPVKRGTGSTFFAAHGMRTASHHHSDGRVTVWRPSTARRFHHVRRPQLSHLFHCLLFPSFQSTYRRKEPSVDG